MSPKHVPCCNEYTVKKITQNLSVACDENHMDS